MRVDVLYIGTFLVLYCHHTDPRRVPSHIGQKYMQLHEREMIVKQMNDGRGGGLLSSGKVHENYMHALSSRLQQNIRFDERSIHIEHITPVILQPEWIQSNELQPSSQDTSKPLKKRWLDSGDNTQNKFNAPVHMVWQR